MNSEAITAEVAVLLQIYRDKVKQNATAAELEAILTILEEV